ncbi:hypothetical protein V2S84_13065, partial [Azotobacter chroococcum]|nr:hypothetical protein [Azotobacter chroococcum]
MACRRPPTGARSEVAEVRQRRFSIRVPVVRGRAANNPQRWSSERPQRSPVNPEQELLEVALFR